MLFNSIKSTRIKLILVFTVLSIVIALPVMSQPLGIVTVIGQNDTKKSVEEEQEKPELPLTVFSEPENLTYKEDGLSRSQSDLPTITKQPEATKSEIVEPEIPEISQKITEPAFSADFISTLKNEAQFFEPIEKSLYITATSLNLRTKADPESEVKSELAMGTKVMATAENGEWLYVESDSVSGFISSEYTSSEMVFVPVEQTRYVDTDKLNLREGFSEEAAIIEILNRDAKLARTGVGDGWSCVKTTSGKIGYVNSNYLTADAPALPQPTKAPVLQNGTLVGNAGRGEIVALAKSGLGVPYVYGGSSLSGFDCSGFTSWVYRQVGITIPRTTSGYYNAGIGVTLSEAKPGDIICMDANSRDGRTSISHVGVYVGNGQMLHASTSKQRIVSVNVNTFFNYGIELITVRRFVD